MVPGRLFRFQDEAGKTLPVPCRVGTAVDVVAQAGKPKTITGFQTHNTPVRRDWPVQLEAALAHSLLNNLFLLFYLSCTHFRC